MTIDLRRIQYLDPRAVEIRGLMDIEMGELYVGFGDDEGPEFGALIDAALKVDPSAMIATIGAYDGEGEDARLVGHAALRWTTIEGPDGAPIDSLEVKRVIVLEEFRSRGISRGLMAELEVVAREQGCRSMVLQTGPRQGPAIALYETIGYERIANFGLYAPIPSFLCFGKVLDA